MEQIIWNAVVGYEGLYEVSNMGDVRSLEIYVNCKGGAKRLSKGRMMPIRKNNRGYCTVSLHHNNKTNRFLLHRIVAEAFIPNPNNLPQVNHLDEDIENNSVTNLEWVSDDDNKRHSSIENGGTQRPKRPVVVTNIETNEVCCFGGLREAERALGLEHKSALSVVKGKQKQTKGYVIRYVKGGGECDTESTIS